jgi:hypothetical protein
MKHYQQNAHARVSVFVLLLLFFLFCLVFSYTMCLSLLLPLYIDTCWWWLIMHVIKQKQFKTTKATKLYASAYTQCRKALERQKTTNGAYERRTHTQTHTHTQTKPMLYQEKEIDLSSSLLILILTPLTVLHRHNSSPSSYQTKQQNPS